MERAPRLAALASVVVPLAFAGCSGTTSTDADSAPPRDAGLRDAPADAPSGRDRTLNDVTADHRGGDASAPDSAACVPAEAGPASLAALDVTAASDAASPLTLTPPFSPTVHDYYVRCAAGVNDVTVTLTASAGATAAITQPTTSPSLPAQTVSVSLKESQAVVATVTSGGASDEYWVRCLPHDFPRMTWTTHGDPCARTPGYYVIGTMSLPFGVGGYAIVLDSNGAPVWYSGNGGIPVYDVETLTSGTITFSAYGWHVVTLSPFSKTWLNAAGPCPYCGTPDEHELRVLEPSGHYLGFSSARQTGVDLTGLTIPLADGGVYAYGKNASIYACDIFELDLAGKVYWTWRATDHFDPVKVMTYRVGALATPEAEPFHCNAMDVDPTTGNILVSARNMDSVFYVERSTGKVLWKMGGADSSLDGATYVPVADPFFRQHDVRLLPGWKETCSGGSGSISLYDDETDVTSSGKNVPARAAVYDVVVNDDSCGDGGTGGKTGATLAWQFSNPYNYSSSATGGFRVSADGSRVIGWGQSEPGGSQLLFTEVDTKGQDLLDLVCPDGSSSFRAVKVPLTAFDLAVLRSTSGAP